MSEKINWAGRRELARQISTGNFFGLEFFPDGRIFSSGLIPPNSVSSVTLSELDYDDDVSWDYEPKLYETLREEPLS